MGGNHAAYRCAGLGFVFQSMPMVYTTISLDLGIMNVQEYYLINYGQLFHTETNCPICEGIDQ